MIEIYRKILDVLDKKERRNAVVLFAMMLIMGVLDVIGVGSIMPFISVVADPGSIESNGYLRYLYERLSFSSANTFTLFLGVMVFALVLGSLAFKALTHFVMARFAHMRNFTLSRRLLGGYLQRPYRFFLNRHSADLATSVLNEVQQIVVSILFPAVNLLAHGIVTLFLTALVVAVNPAVAAYAVLFLGGSYALIYLSLRSYNSRIGDERLESNKERFRIAQESFGGVKEVKVLGLEKAYLNRFSIPAKRYSNAQAANQIILQVPRFALEALVVGGMLVLLLSLIELEDGNLADVIPILALYAFAGIRLMPSLQQVYASVTSLRYAQSSLIKLHSDLTETDRVLSSKTEYEELDSRDILHMVSSIRLEQLWYCYPNTEKPAIKGMNLEIPAGTTVALVGSTGAGKTTVVDIILGLLEPQSGELKVDGVQVDREMSQAWRNNIGYVPQNIFLIDDTVAANIAFGVPENQVDYEAVKRAGQMAELHDFVVKETPRGYETLVGDKGVRLSGGQRQRIGIARALYHDPDVLLLDEATSALDNLTEEAVMNCVHSFAKRKTIIMIAHRLTTVRRCNTIFVLDDGKVAESGSYEELIENDSIFVKLAIQEKH